MYAERDAVVKKIISIFLTVLMITSVSIGFDYTCYADQPTVFVSSNSIKAKSGQRVKIPIKIKNNTGLLGFKLTFSYDAEKMKPETIEYGDCFDSGLQDNIEGDA